MGKHGFQVVLDKVPIVGNHTPMTLKEYIKAGHSDMSQVAEALGVSEHAVHKWMYGQRTPSLQTALDIVRVTGGKVELASLVSAA